MGPAEGRRPEPPSSREEAEVNLLPIPGEHARPCTTPKLKRWHTPGCLWLCTECQQMWVVMEVGGWDASWKTWEKVDL